MPECPVNCRCLGLQGPALIHSPSENLQTQKMQLAISERLPEAGLCVCTHLCTQLKHHLPSSPLPHALSTCHGSPRASLLVFSWSTSWDAQGLLSQGQEHYEEVWRPQDSGGMVELLLLQQVLGDSPTVYLTCLASSPSYHFQPFSPSHTASWLFLDRARPPPTSGPFYLQCSLPILSPVRYSHLTPWLSLGLSQTSSLPVKTSPAMLFKMVPPSSLGLPYLLS